MEDPKDIVKNAYDNIAPWYLNWVENDRSPRERYTAKLLNDCAQGANILDLGCGPGVPVMRILLNGGANVTGCDISSRQLELAKAKFPEASLIQSDMASLSFDPSSFDGIACFYTFFHLPRSEQESFLGKIYSWLKPGGMYVMNCAMFDEEEIHGEFLGWGTFWSGFGMEDNKAMLARVGFEIVKEELVQSGDGQLEEDDPDYGVEFWWVAAKRPLESAGKLGAGEGEVNSSKTSS